MPDNENNTSQFSDMSSTKNRILQIATGLFLERGYDQVTLDEIVKQARVSKTSVYKIFGSKEDPLHAVVENSGLEVISDAFNDPPGGDIKAKLHHVGASYLQRFLDPKSLTTMRFCLALAPRFPWIGKYFMEYANRRAAERAAALIAAWNAQNLIHAEDPAEAAELYLQLLRAKHQLEALSDPDYQPSDEQVDKDVSSAVDTLLIILESAPIV